MSTAIPRPAARSTARNRPIARSKPRQHSALEPSEPSLVVVGETQRRETVAASLASLRLRVETADSVVETLAAAELDVVGLVLIPPLPGPDPMSVAVRALRADSRTRRLPVFVVVPEDAGLRDVRRLYAEGVTAVLEWPREALLLPRIVGELMSVTPRPGSRRPSDRALARAASARLRLIEGAEDLRVGATEGVLHLRGTVPSLQVKESLIAFAARVPGVRSIADDALLVRKSGQSDRTIGNRVRSLLGSISEGDTLSVSVNDGHVVLMGSIEGREAFEQVVTLLASVRGVRAITNLTRKSTSRRRQDHRVARSLQRAIEQSHPSARVRVAVLGEVAVLTGEVDIVATRSAIRRRARAEDEIERVVDKLEVTG